MGRVLALALALGLAASVGAAEKFSKGVLWRVSKPGVPPSHVYGTVHLADPRALKIPPQVMRALDASRSYAMEVPIWDAHDWRMLEAAQYRDGRSLRAQLDAETWAMLRTILVARDIPETVIARLKPWAALANITVVPDNYESENLDQRLFAMARARKLRIEALEGTEEHLSVFEGIPEAAQLAMLRHTVENRDWLAGMIEPTLQAWLRRDLAGIRRVNDSIAARYPGMAPHYQTFLRHVVVNRSVVMAHRLHGPLRSGRVFVAVGATHLYGSKGLLAMIEEQGYRVTSVY